MPLRQTTGFVESLLRLIGLDWTVPDFSTLSRRQKTLAVDIPYRGSKDPLHLLIDSTGIKVERYEREAHTPAGRHHAGSSHWNATGPRDNGRGHAEALAGQDWTTLTRQREAALRVIKNHDVSPGRACRLRNRQREGHAPGQ